MILADDDKCFICKNSKYKQHQCFACGKLGSSNLSSKAEVGMAESYFVKSLKLIYFERFDEMALRLGKIRRKEHFLLVLKKNAQVSQDAPEWTYAQNARNSVTCMAACSHLNILNSFCLCLDRCSNVRSMIVGAFTTQSVLLNCSTRIANSMPHFWGTKLQPDKISLAPFMNVLCAREKGTRMIRTSNVQYADAAQLQPPYSCPFLVMFYW